MSPLHKKTALHLLPLVLLFFSGRLDAQDSPTPAELPESDEKARSTVGQRLALPGTLEWITDAAGRPPDIDGKVVLIRFWTDTCPFCARSAPALRRLHETYSEKGLLVLGIYHAKPYGREANPYLARRKLDQWDWKFPVAIDHRWKFLWGAWLSSKKPERK